MKEIKIQIGDQVIAGLDNEEKSEHILLALHGWLDNAASFTPIMPHLNGYRVVAIDFPGHGYSSHRPEGAHYHFVDWIETIVHVIQHFGWSSVTVVGHSMGGMVATVLAASFPELIERLILIDSIGLVTTVPEEAPKQLRDAILSRKKMKAKSRNVYSSIHQAVEARSVVGNFHSDIARYLVERGAISTSEGVKFTADIRLNIPSALRFTPSQAEAFISQITCPVLMMLAEDRIGELNQRVEKAIGMYQRHYQNLTMLSTKGGHHCHMEFPDETAQKMKAWLNND
ncbi:alpha/beta fold hydrolase [Algicola sagamiensis]|uniref:alpha/beta fold hydrolase n=1 Tax=Algicola sagamiensis TaxID=163869 RepID=UPI000362C95E|nr:alpha/beta hydrolase [Algicola sagamiensis]